MKSWVVIGCGIIVAGCVSMAPVYHRPETSVAQTWPDGSPPPIAGAATSLPADRLGWRAYFTDPRIQQLIELALANNRDLRVTILNIETDRAQYQIQRAALFPTIDAVGSGTYERVPGSASPTTRYTNENTTSATVGFTSYELDFFGRIRSLKNKALEEYFATEQARLSSQLTLVGEVVSDYLTLAADGESLRLAEDTLISQRASYDLTKQMFGAGDATLLSLRQAESTVDSARVSVASYKTTVAQDYDALVLIVGTPIPTGIVTQTLPQLLSSLDELPADIPSVVLQRRPDVLESEHTLKADNANIGAARAAFFPTITLTGSAGSTSPALSGLFKAGTFVRSIEPQISLPIFDAGSNRASLRVANVQRDIDIAQYQRTIQSAFHDVADALAQRANIGEQLAGQRALVDADADSYRLSEALFRNGIDSYLDLLVSQQTLYAAQQSLIAVRLTRLQNLVTLYKVLGGGALENNAP